MILGLYDSDMIKYKQVPFNLELMKLSTYYKKNLEIVTMSPSFSPEKYTHFIYRKDYYDGEFPKDLYKIKNLEYGGRAFNPNNYIPLAEDIEKCKADKFIYEIYKKNFNNKLMQSMYKVMYNAEHFRLSLNNKTIWENFEKQLNISPRTQTLFLHDYNLNEIQNSDIIIKDIMKRIKHRCFLAMKFPVQVNNGIDLFKWFNFNTSANFFSVQYNGIMDDDILVNFLDENTNKYAIRQMDYCITKSYTEDEFLSRINQLFLQVVYLKTKKIKLNLVYEYNFFSDKYWEKVIDLFNLFLSGAYDSNNNFFQYHYKKASLYDFVRKFKDIKYYVYSKEDARQIFRFVAKNNYELFKNFYECHEVKLRGGNLQNE